MADLANPFHGLRTFEIGESALFFGRDEETHELLRRLRMLRFLAVLGPSGCGKSSLIRAGVLAALRDGYMAGDGAWHPIVLQPGNAPVEAWCAAACAAAASPDGRIAILVDQFEELFQFVERTGNERQAREFLNAVLAAAASPDGRTHVIVTMRTEYLSECAAFPELAEAINESFYLVPRMTREQLRRAIVGPVERVGGAITEPLVDRLLNDVSAEPDALPLLQHALTRMWRKKRPWEPLGLEEYVATGGVVSFLSEHAGEIYRQLQPGQQRAAEALFRTITELTGDQRAVRRPASLRYVAEATGEPEAALQAAFEAFRAEGFLRTLAGGGPEGALIDISHEAIARHWTQLRDWMVAQARARRSLRRLQDTAAAWREHNRDRAYFFRGVEFQEAEAAVRCCGRVLDPETRDFFERSRRGERWRKILSPGYVIALIVISALATVNLWTARQATIKARQARASEQQARDTEKFAIAAQRAAERERDEAIRVRQQLRAAWSRESNLLAPMAPRFAAQIFIQIRDVAQRPQLAAAEHSLRRAGFEVLPAERLDFGPKHSEIRYFHDSERELAEKAAAALREAGTEAATVKLPGLEDTRRRLGRLELWLTPPAASAR